MVKRDTRIYKQKLHRTDGTGASGHSRQSAGGPRPQYVARSRWSGSFLSLSTSYTAADRDGPRSGGGAVKVRPPVAPLSPQRRGLHVIAANRAQDGQTTRVLWT